MKKFNFIKIVVSFSLLLSVLNLTSVKAIENMTLARNDKLTSQSFETNEDSYFVTNDISNVEFAFLMNYNILQLRHDLEVELIGNIESINTNTCSGFVGFYEGKLQDGTILSINLTYSDNEMLAALTVGCIGDDCFGTTYFGDTNDKIKQIDDVYSKMLISQNKINEEQSDETIDNLQNNSNSRSTTSTGIKLQGTTTTSKGGYTIGQLSVFHADELKANTAMNTTARVNTNYTNMRSYLSGQGYNTTAMFIVPIQFDISIKSNSYRIEALASSYYPQNNKTTWTITIPYTTSTGIGTKSISFLAGSTTVTAGKSSGAINPNQFTWVIKKTGGWGQKEFDGNASSSNGMSTLVTYSYQNTTSSTVTANIAFTATIKYSVVYYPDPEEDTQKTITLSTSQMSKTTSVKLTSS